MTAPRPSLCALVLALCPVLSTQAQEIWHELNHDIYYKAEATTTLNSSANNPFWLTANRHGATGVEPSQHQLRLAIERPIAADSNRVWRMGYGIDALYGKGLLSPFQLQQAYVQLQYQNVGITLGQKQQAAELRHPLLSTGALLLGENARPVPSLRIETPRWVNLDEDGRWMAIKLQMSYGMMTDGSWQRDYQAPSSPYAMKGLLHTKAGYLRIGHPKFYRLTFVGGLEMATQFGGRLYNVGGWGGQQATPIQMGEGFKDFLHAFIAGGGGDVTDGKGYANVTGNTLGAWRASLSYRPSDRWALRAYYDHFFEDHSALLFQYGWLDGQYGLEITLPRNRWISSLVVEHLRTDYQSGPIYHDGTPQVGDQVSGVDNYYNHNLYRGWQHYGMAIGNPLFTSPLYERDQRLIFRSTRFRANHIGLAGQPLPQLNYRLLYTHLRSWGTYGDPFAEVEHQHSFLLEAQYRWLTARQRHTHEPSSQHSWREGWSVKAALAFDRGARLGNNLGLQITIAKTGLLSKY